MSRDSHIKPWLLGWTQQLRGWAEDGSLLAAAQQALLLEESPQQLVELLDQWGASDFSALPAIETLSRQDIAGARGAYVEDLSRIFLNQEWLAEASDQEISEVLTEELGHHLDAVLNDFDTPGDEGELFSAILGGTAHNLTRLSLEDDQLIINIDGFEFEAEASGESEGDPDPSSEFEGDPDPSSEFEGDPDPSSEFEGDPDPSSESEGDTDPPVFTSGSTATAIDENTGSGQIIYTAVATDDSSIQYSLRPGVGDDVSFSIDPSSGEVTLLDDPDYETKPSYSFTVIATDDFGNDSDQVVALAVNDLDELPPDKPSTPDLAPRF
ncbi:MAG: cadherin domain-containing protein [Parasynechococcus sp.]|uniref:cadherin repeat domain-containing protein n=1 Tax=Parasynechococcus sp. TaxID=3101203 RepID=UPI003885E792